LVIREREYEEIATEVEIINAARPADWHTSVEEMQGWESLRRPEDLVLRLLAFMDDQPVGAARCDFREHFKAGRFDAEVVYVGLSLLGRQTAEKAFTWTTGVHPADRGRGVAKAMKYLSAVQAQGHGFRVMRTFNHPNNPAMLALSEGMGHVPLPDVVEFVRDLT
jgi:GNAT superfamily N-acetyltransferase